MQVTQCDSCKATIPNQDALYVSIHKSTVSAGIDKRIKGFDLCDKCYGNLLRAMKIPK